MHALWFLQEQHCSRLPASLLTAQSYTQPSTEEGRWLLESAQKAQIERGLVCTGANAVVVLGITERHLSTIKTGTKVAFEKWRLDQPD